MKLCLSVVSTATCLWYQNVGVKHIRIALASIAMAISIRSHRHFLLTNYRPQPTTIGYCVIKSGIKRRSPRPADARPVAVKFVQLYKILPR